MFEASLKSKLKRIFDLKKATFNAHGDLADIHSDSKEQECIFIKVESAKNSIKDKLQVSQVKGKISVFCNSEKLPYGYFSKKIQSAKHEDTKDLFFFDIEENSNIFQNISQRSMSFIYLFNSQYNPEIGTLNELETFEVVNE